MNKSAKRRPSLAVLPGNEEILFLELADASMDGIVVFDAEWRYLYLNAEGERITGKRREDMIGKVAWEVYPQMVGGPFHALYTRCMDERVTISTEEYYAPRNQWYEVRCVPSARTGGIIVYFRDITARHQAETDRRRTEERLNTILDNAPFSVYFKDADDRLLFVNRKAAELLGRSSQEIIGLREEEVISGDLLHAFHQTDRETGISRQMREVQTSLTYPDGTRRPVRSFRFPLTADEYHPIFCTISYDVTDAWDTLEKDRLLQEVIAESAVQYRRTLREVLWVVTDGVLHLIDSPEELPALLSPHPIVPPLILSRHSLGSLRRTIERASKIVGMDSLSVFDLQVAAGEAAANAITHGGGGTASVYISPPRGSVQIVIEDTGPGLSSATLHHALLGKGWTTAGTLGQGFWMMLRTISRLYLLTRPEGTTIVLERENGTLSPLTCDLDSTGTRYSE